MTTITIQQPYAALVRSGAKWIENRGWATRHRGRLAIHAGRGAKYCRDSGLITGAVIATAELVDCVALADLAANPDGPMIGHRTRRSILEHYHCEGPWLWILDDVKAVDPAISARGMPGLFRVPVPA